MSIRFDQYVDKGVRIHAIGDVEFVGTVTGDCC